MPPVKRNIISIDTKLKIIDDSDKMSYIDLAKMYNLPRTTISAIIKQKDQIIKSVKPIVS